MPRKRPRRCKNSPRHPGPFSRDLGLCPACSLKRCIAGGRKGGKKRKGEKKRIAGKLGGESSSGNTQNGQCKRATGKCGSGNTESGPRKRAAGRLGGEKSSGNTKTGPRKRAAGKLGGEKGSGNTVKGPQKRAAGRVGGGATGESKARKGMTNGQCTLDLKRHQTWRVLDVPLEVFSELLSTIHEKRLAKATQPFLREEKLPPHIRDAGYSDLREVLQLMNTTTFGHPDRFMDRVSREILYVMRTALTDEWAVAVSAALRFKSSPHGLAEKLAAATPSAFRKLVAQSKNGTAYEQTGISKEDVSTGVLEAAKAVAAKAPYSDWEALEDAVATEMMAACEAPVLERFSARQVAADLCRRKKFVGNLTTGVRPKTSRLGPGAQKGWFFAERAKKRLVKKHRIAKCPRRVEYQKQTILCEYSNLVKRMNFPHIARLHRYVAKQQPLRC